MNEPSIAPWPAPSRLADALLARALLARVLLAGILLAALGGCGAPEATPATPAAAPGADESVKPGINDPFLDPALDVEHFVKTFEGESREIAKSRDAIVAALGLRRGMTVADIGAGTGLFLQPLAEAVGTRGRLYAVDLAPAFVAHLEERASGLQLPQVQVVTCTDRSVELPRDSVDLAFVCDTYHHFEHPQETLASLRSAIRPGGRLVIVDFEREAGTSRDWVLDHVRLGRQATRAEVEAAGFHFLDEVNVQGLHENYLLRFERP